MTGLMPTGVVFPLGADCKDAKNGDMRIVLPPKEDFNTPKDGGLYAYVRAEVRFCGVWVPYGASDAKSLRLWRECGGDFTEMRLELYRALLMTVREPFRLDENSIYAPVDGGIYERLEQIADRLLYKNVVVTDRKAEPKNDVSKGDVAKVVKKPRRRVKA